MEPYNEGSIGNRNQTYQQSPAFSHSHQHGPQYAQQQAQNYSKGPNQKYNGRKHAYSVDQQAIKRNRNNRPQKTKQKPPQQQQHRSQHNQYLQFQQYQKEQQRQHRSSQPQPQPQPLPQHQMRRNKQRRGNSHSPSPSPNRQHHSSTPNAGAKDRHSVHKKRRRRKRRSNNEERNEYTGYVSPSPSPSPQPRRHTTNNISSHGHGHGGSNHAKLNKGKLAEKFTIREKLGRGNFSVVRRVIRKTDSREFAAKIISTKTMSSSEIKDTHDEVDILAKLHHPNIVTLVDYIFTPRHLYIVLELLSGGELFERLQKKKRFNEQMAANITKQIADALSYMHSKGVVHRDLKPENILYEHLGADAKIKISDFGLSRDISSQSDLDLRPLKTSCGTPGYVAPEIIRQQTYDESVDLWAAGVIIYILLSGFPPFHGTGVEPQQSMFRKIKSGKYSYPKPAWSKISACAMDCIDSLLCVNPKDRMTAKELLAHPWIKQAEMRNEDSFLDIHFQSNLSNYLHKKRFRRGVRLIITLNRMVRGSGLEPIAREQRKQFRIRLKEYKKQLKDQQRKIYNKQQQLKLMNEQSEDYDDEYLGYTIIDPDSTPAIDYSKV